MDFSAKTLLYQNLSYNCGGGKFILNAQNSCLCAVHQRSSGGGYMSYELHHLVDYNRFPFAKVSILFLTSKENTKKFPPPSLTTTSGGPALSANPPEGYTLYHIYTSFTSYLSNCQQSRWVSPCGLLKQRKRS